MRPKTCIKLALMFVLVLVCSIFKYSRRKVDAQQLEKMVTLHDKVPANAPTNFPKIAPITNFPKNAQYTSEHGLSTSVSTTNSQKNAPYTPKHAFSLILGYSGDASLWFRDVLSYAEECFYIYEPPMMITDDRNGQAYSEEKEYHTLRDSISVEDQKGTNISIYYKLFTCNFSSIGMLYNEHYLNATVELYADRAPFKYCGKGHAWNSMKCIKELTEMCLLKSHTCIMTTELSVNIVSKMMDLWPNLKAIHAIEEPYAILSSRLADDCPPRGFNVQRNSINLCARMYNDFKNTRVLQKKFPGRLKLLSFEAIKASPFSAAGHIYEFFDLFLFTEKVWFWVYSNIQRTIKREIYDHSQLNLTESDYRCRKDLADQIVAAIYLSCNDVYYYISGVFNLTKILLLRGNNFLKK